MPKYSNPLILFSTVRGAAVPQPFIADIIGHIADRPPISPSTVKRLHRLPPQRPRCKRFHPRGGTTQATRPRPPFPCVSLGLTAAAAGSLRECGLSASQYRSDQDAPSSRGFCVVLDRLLPPWSCPVKPIWWHCMRSRLGIRGAQQQMIY